MMDVEGDNDMEEDWNFKQDDEEGSWEEVNRAKI